MQNKTMNFVVLMQNFCNKFPFRSVLAYKPTITDYSSKVATSAECIQKEAGARSTATWTHGYKLFSLAAGSRVIVILFFISRTILPKSIIYEKQIKCIHYDMGIPIPFLPHSNRVI